jgi:enterochelin esterase-like enzyme
MSSQPSHKSAQEPAQQQLTLVESLMDHIDAFQSGEANEMTYLSAMNALRDLHAYVKKTVKIQESAKKSSVIIMIDGEEFFVEDYHDTRIAIRFTDNFAYSSDTGDFMGIWNEATRIVEELPSDDE